MKKLLFLFFIFSSYSITNTQTTFGVKGGLNMASIVKNYNTPIENKYKLGFQLGGFVKFGLSEKFYLQPELLYSLQGTKFGKIDLTNIVLPQNDLDDLFASYNGNSKQNESNIILPVMLKYYLNDKFNLEFGPQLDYLFNTKSDAIRIENGQIVSNEENNSESDFNFGLNLGAGYNFNENFGLNLRYHYGFNRLKKGGALAAYDTGQKSRNSVFSLNLEYRFIK